MGLSRVRVVFADHLGGKREKKKKKIIKHVSLRPDTYNFPFLGSD
jgi:hypothetical protein